MKTNILFLLLSIFSITVQSQPKSTSPEQCVDLYLAWKDTPTTAHSKQLFHPKAELRWLEGGTWYSTPAEDYIQKMEANKQIERQHKLISITTEGRRALAVVEEYYPDEQLQTLASIQLEKSKKGWQIRSISYTDTLSKASATPQFFQKK